jgi:N-methylhydantoinase B
MDVHAWWPHVTSIPVEYAESYFPVRIDRLASRMDSGGAGKHRGGNGVDKVYSFVEPGQVSIHDDRHISQPWGIGGGRAAERSRKILLRKDGTELELPSKFDFLDVEPGDRLLYLTAGGGGWGDPLEREAERVRADVERRFVSVDKARSDYGVVLDEASLTVDEAATAALRDELRDRRVGDGELFDFGDGNGAALGARNEREPAPAPVTSPA